MAVSSSSLFNFASFSTPLIFVDEVLFRRVNSFSVLCSLSLFFSFSERLIYREPMFLRKSWYPETAFAISNH